MAFRDVGAFYFPLFQFIQDEWHAGRVPLWNPYDDCGMPLVGMGSSSVFYPLKLVFLLPFAYETLFAAYVIIHVLLAAFAAHHCAIALKLPSAAAAIAAVSYAFSGSVLFLATNVIFLCGAAWLPFALLFGNSIFAPAAWPWANLVKLAVVLALMICAGDPQMAYISAACIGLRGVLGPEPDQAETVDSRRFRSRLVTAVSRTAVASGCALALSAIQVVPTFEASQYSERNTPSAPASVYGIPAVLLHRTARADDDASAGVEPSWYDTIIGRPPPDSMHQKKAYEFSLGPWRLFEFVWPNASGRLSPIHTRWLDARLETERAQGIWFPSLYMGIFPFCMAVAAMLLKTKSHDVRWLKWLAIAALIASFGGYGLIWIIKAVAATAGFTVSVPIGDEVGGLYWLFNLLLPGFDKFRYPAKLMVVAALAFSLLAAIGTRELLNGNRHVQRWLVRCFIVIFAGSLLALAALPLWTDFVSRIPNDAAFGPFDASLARWSLVSGIVQGVFFSGICLFATRMPATILVLITGIDLGLAQSSLIETVPSSVYEPQPAVAKAIAAERGPDAEAPFRVQVMPADHPRFAADSSRERAIELMAHQRAQLMPRHNLTERIALVRGADSMTFSGFADYWVTAEQPDPESGQTLFIQPRRSYDAWNVEYFVLPEAHDTSRPSLSVAGLTQQWADGSSGESDELVPTGPHLKRISIPDHPEIALLKNSSAFPRAWIVHDVEFREPLHENDVAGRRRLTTSMMFPSPQRRNLRQTAVVETNDPEFLADRHASWSVDPTHRESCRVTRHEPQRVEIEVRLVATGLVVLSDTWFPGWTATVQGERDAARQDVLRTNRMMRGVLLDAGRHRVVFEYRPVSFMMGATVSLVAWLLLPAVLVISRKRR